LKANGAIATDEQSIRVLVQRQDMTGAERSWASRYEINDVIRYARGSKNIGIDAGEYGKVVRINSADNLITVERSTGEVANYDPRRLNASACIGRSRGSLPLATVFNSPLRTSRLASRTATLPPSNP
jgi:hypothetical protein